MNAITQYSLKNKALEIYISGCKEHPCKGCHNPEMWNESIGDIVNSEFLYNIDKKITFFTKLIDKVMIFGGEPLEKPVEEIVYLLSFLKQYNKEIWLFTRFPLDRISNDILFLCDYIKTGGFNEKLYSDDYYSYGIQLKSTNQVVHRKGIDFCIE